MNTIWRYLLIVAFTLLLLPALAAESPLTLQVLPANTEAKRFTFGERAPVRFVLKNTSDRVLVVTRIESSLNPNEEPVSLVGNVPGEIRKATDRDAYIRPPAVAQVISFTPLYGGLLLPEQVLSFTAPYRPLIAADEFVISYYSADQAYKHTRESMAPLVVYSQGFPEKEGAPERWMFLPFAETEWLKHIDTEHLTSTSLLGNRAVIIGAGIVGKPKETKVKQSFTFADPQPSITPENLRKVVAQVTKVDPPAIIMVAYCSTLGGFCLQEADNRWVLSRADQQDRGAPFPEWNFSLLNDIDLNGKVLIKVGKKQLGLGPDRRDARWKLWDTYPVFYGDGMYTNGEFIEITAAQLRDFLLRMREAGGILDTEHYFINGRYYWMKILE